MTVVMRVFLRRRRSYIPDRDIPKTDNTSGSIAEDQGPVLLQDIHLIDNLAHLDREQLPERILHAKGTGAHGYFRVYKSMAPVTKAKFLQDPEKRNTGTGQVLYRYRVPGGLRNSARDIRGFAVKFYTEDGNYDLVGSKSPGLHHQGCPSGFRR